MPGNSIPENHVAQFSNAQRAVPVALSDTVGFPECEALYVNGSGVVQVVFANGSTAAFTVTSAAPLLVVKASRVNATGTTASNILALY